MPVIEQKRIKQAFENFTRTLNETFQLKGVFFDMDGVLFDSMPLHALAWQEAFQKYGLELPEFEAFMNEGSTALYTVRKMYKKYLNKEASPELIEEIKQKKHDYMASLPPANIMANMPELLELMDRQKLDCWIVTGSAQKILINRIEKEYKGILNHKKAVTAYDVKNGKPNPEPYLIGMKKSGLKINDSIVVENAPLGIVAAKAAGLFTVAINTGPLDHDVLEKAGADLVLSGSHELLKTWPMIYNILLNKGQK